MFKRLTGLVTITFILALSSISYAEESDKSQGMPPAQVVVAEITSGMIAPVNVFIGTVYYREKSNVATEVSGKVDTVNVDDGERVKKGDVLVQLDTELLEKRLQATIASHEEALSDLEQAKTELIRAETLFKEELISEQNYDSTRFRVQSLGKKAASLKADVERLEVELRKTAIKAPFDGIVVRKEVERGEWLSSDSTAMTIGMDDYMAPVVNVPEQILPFIKLNEYVDVEIGGNKMDGMIYAIIPKGDALTRTFPVKIAVKNTFSLYEGMEAKVTLPTGKKEKAMIVPRDAVINVFGNTVVYAVIDSRASMIPVTIVGYNGMNAGVQDQGLSEGMKVVVKGNERLQDGQAVVITNE